MREHHPRSIKEQRSANPVDPAEQPAEGSEATEIAPHPGPDRADADVERERAPIEFGTTSVKNKRKGANEDRVLANARLGLYGVFDGVGGHAAGEIAAKRAEELILLGCNENRAISANGDLAAARLAAAVNDASAELFAESRNVPELDGMGTTLSLMQIIRDAESGLPREAVIANVGDSRWYRLRNGTLEQLTTDDTIIQGLIDEGILPPEVDQVGDPNADARITPEQRDKVLTERNVVTQSVGDPEPITTRILRVALAPGDIYFATTDGIHDVLLASEIETITAANADHPDAIPSALADAAAKRGAEWYSKHQADEAIDGALVRGKDDDQSAVALRINAVHEEAPSATPPSPERPIDAEQRRAWETMPPNALVRRLHTVEHATLTGDDAARRDVIAAGMRDVLATRGFEASMENGEPVARRALDATSVEFLRGLAGDEKGRDELAEIQEQFERDIAWIDGEHMEANEDVGIAIAQHVLDDHRIPRLTEFAARYQSLTDEGQRRAVLQIMRSYKDAAVRAIDRLLEADA